MTDSPAQSPVCSHVKNWLDRMVIAHNFCPFARFVRDQNSIRYVEVESHDMAEILAILNTELQFLDANSATSTTLLILPTGWDDFDTYLLLVDMAQQSLEHWQYEGIYQLASFHPNYLFAGEPAEAASHYTNRAPYPVLHIIREADIEQALAHYPNPESIPETNIATTEKIGKQQLAEQLANCKKS